MKAAPLFADVADGPEGGAAHWLRTTDGVRIRAGHWSADGLRGTVLLFPGRTEYVEKYGRAARDLMGRGYATVAVDWRGQGLAARLQDNRAVGHVESFSDYQKDVVALVAHVCALGLPQPLHLIAHSMGGCIGLRALREGLPVRAAVFSAPMWGLRMSAALRPLAWLLSGLARPLRLSHAFVPGQRAESYLGQVDFDLNALTSDREMFAHMQRQVRTYPDLSLGGPSLHWLDEALREMRTLARRPAPDLPCLTFLGSEEAVVDPDRIRARMEHWPGGELVMLPGARHEIMMERRAFRDSVFDRATAFLDRQR